MKPIMPLYFFPDQPWPLRRRIRSGIRIREAAWAEMTKVCGNLLGSILRSLKQNAEWQMELLDETRKPVFRIRLVAESVS